MEQLPSSILIYFFPIYFCRVTEFARCLQLLVFLLKLNLESPSYQQKFDVTSIDLSVHRRICCFSLNFLGGFFSSGPQEKSLHIDLMRNLFALHLTSFCITGVLWSRDDNELTGDHRFKQSLPWHMITISYVTKFRKYFRGLTFSEGKKSASRHVLWLLIAFVKWVIRP